MRKNVNTEIIEGRIYTHDLKVKTVQNSQSKNYGKEFISGSVSIATDENGLNVLPVYYTYITEYTNNDKADSRFSLLKKIMEGKTWLKDGKDAAPLVRLTPSAALNDYYPQGGDELVSQARNEGGFINLVNTLVPDGINRRKFTFDTIINGASLVEADPERGINEDYLKLNCLIFNFRNDVLPFTLVARDPSAINYFMGLEPSNQNVIYTQVWGEIVNTTVKVEKKTESAFGAPVVDVTERSQREWVITGAKPEPYVFDDESTITIAELKKALADRNVYLEDVKTRAKAYYSGRDAATVETKIAFSTGSMNVPSGDFKF